MHCSQLADDIHSRTFTRLCTDKGKKLLVVLILVT